KGKKLMVGYWSRFSPALQFGMEAFDDGLLGEPYVAYGYLVRRRGIPGIPTFIDKVLSGGKGALLDIGCYIIDNILAILKYRKPISVNGMIYTKFGNNPDEVKFNWGNWDPSKFELEDYAVGYIRLEGGISMILEVGWAANVSHVGEKGYMRILGDKGGLEGIGTEDIKEIALYSRTKNFLIDTKPVLPNRDLPLEMVRTFINSIITNSEPPVSGYQSIILHAIIDGIYKSAIKGEEIKIEVPEI
ncbi:MAG: Gfo/Idh/MocA family oxidoreductase, partial [Sulfolobus sp.]|nr:Gfo/Idh/MocA family oxidoreductase [Sulfolobus sp.]